VSLIGILSIISEGVVHLFEIKEHCIIIELTVEPTGVSVEDVFQDAVCVVDGNVPASNPIIFLIDPDDAKTNCGVLAVVGNPVKLPEEYKPVEGLVYEPIELGTKNVNN
jgi:hypothetical protein